MGRRIRRVPLILNTDGIKKLPLPEIKAILRGADHLIMSGGRSMLSKILKGSKDKKLLKLKLNKSPVYGFFKELTISKIRSKIDWTIVNGYLRIEYDYRLPLLVYTKKGWEIEKDTYSDELLNKLKELLETGDYSFVTELKDRDRSMILLLLDKIKNTNNREFIPLLKAWKKIDYRKVRAAIRKVIKSLHE